MLYVTDYLGSVRAVVNGATGAIYKASDFSAFGAESDAASVQKISAPLGTTFRDAYTGKEDQHPDFGTGYTDFGARQYSPALRRWMAPDPLSEKYYGISPYAFCNDNPVNIVDADGESWYYNSETGNFVTFIDDADDFIYMITPEQINQANGDNNIISSFKSDNNMFGQLALEGLVEENVAQAVVSDLFKRTNTNVDGTKFVDIEVPIKINDNMAEYAKVIVQRTKGSSKRTLERLEVNSSAFFNGYDSMLLLAHEIGHIVDIVGNTMSDKSAEQEIFADLFAKNHWVYQKASDFAKKRIQAHENQSN